VTTVSNVFGEKDNRVSPEVREKIMQLAENMKYRPNKIAKALVENRSEIISVMLEQNSTMKKHIYQSLVSGVLSNCTKNKYRVLLDTLVDWDDKSSHLLSNEFYDGAIIQAPSLGDKRIDEMMEEDIPFVVIGQSIKNNDDVMFVDVNNVKIAYDITNILIKRGHQKIGFLNSMPNLTITFDRLSGYVKALQEHNISFNPALIYNTDNTQVTGYPCAKDLFKSNPDITAVITCSDDVAVGLYSVIEENNMRICEDVSVFALGGDDYLHTLVPRLSTVKIDYFKIGEAASELLINVLCGKPVSSKHVIVDVEYDIAGSCL
jgi:DNA-binding LacI/PurR family transcriptional regulator